MSLKQRENALKTLRKKAPHNQQVADAKKSDVRRRDDRRLAFQFRTSEIFMTSGQRFLVLRTA